MNYVIKVSIILFKRCLFLVILHAVHPDNPSGIPTSIHCVKLELRYQGYPLTKEFDRCCHHFCHVTHVFFTEQILRYSLVIIFPYKFWHVNCDRP